jgi:hypothetical protein
VRVLWHDHFEGSGNSILDFLSTSSSTGGKYTATWYQFNSTPFDFNPLLLDPVAGVTSLSFVVDGILEDQGGLGFAIQDAFMLSQTSCQGGAPVTGRVDVAVRGPSHSVYFLLFQLLTRAYPGPQRRESESRLPRADQYRQCAAD